MSDQDSDILSMPPPKKVKMTESEEINTMQLGEASMDFTEDSHETNAEFSFSDSKYEDLVNPEEVERLKQFQVLDELKSNDEDSEEESESSDGKSEGLPEEEIEQMLDEDLPEDYKGKREPKEKLYVTRQKIVLEEKGINHFEVLPLDWMMVRHYSGMPVYMHRGTRVCTLSKPYLLGKGNTRRHDIPISAIPCLNYRKALEEEAKQKEIDIRIAEQIKNGSWQKSNNNTPSNKHKDEANQVNVDNKNDKETVVSVETNSNNKNGCEEKCGDNFKASDNDAQKIVNNLVLEKDIALLNYTMDLEISDLESKPKEENGEESTKINGTENLRENAEVKEDVDNNYRKNQLEETITKCPFLKNQEVSNDTPVSIQLNDNEHIQSIPNASTTQSSPITNIESEQVKNDSTAAENPPNSEVNTEQSPVEESPLSAQPVVLPGGIVMPPPRVETVNTSWKTQQLTHEQLNDYCKKLFKFKTVHIMHFKRWADRRKYAKARKTLQYPTLPEGTKLITIPAQPAASTDHAAGLLGAGGKASKRDWVMNMNGRSYLSVFHEYVRRALQKQPVYEFKQLENASSPYQATVYIGGMQYGVGRGTSKRLAKANAARASIQILIPEMKDDAPPADTGEPDFSFFDYVGIEDPRITEFCAATCEPSPHATLRTCLLRNFGAGDRHIHTEMKKLEYQKIELTMKVGKHTATVVCKNKKTAKQRASQAILQALHPHVRSWGSLLRLYGSRSVKSCKEKKLEEQQITLLQDKATHNEPNHAVLDKLRHEMRRLRERDAAVVPIGTLMLKEDLPTHSGSNLNNVDL